jgi:hypothetical protein
MWQRRKAKFQYPMQPVPRTAILVPWFNHNPWFNQTPRFKTPGFNKTWFNLTRFSARETIRVFKNGWSEEAAQFAPAAIAGTWTQLKELARNCQPPAMPAPTHALVVLHRPGGVPLAADDREWLWRKFGVPIFEQVIGAGGELVAAECEAHEGMHIESPQMRLHEMELAGQVDASPCACGRTTPRVRSAPSAAQAAVQPPINQSLEPINQSLERLREVAAYAR